MRRLLNNIMHRSVAATRAAGFTLVEMMVVVVIFVVITSVVVFRYGDFTSNLLVTNGAYEVALEVRQAQTFSLGARASTNTSVDGPLFTQPYGVFINLQDGSTGEGPDTLETKQVIFFVDRDEEGEPGYGQCNNAAGTGVCTCNADECISKLTLQRTTKITEVRTSVVAAETDLCEASNVPQSAVTFKRPSPEARIKRYQEVNDTGFTFMQIKVEDKNSSIKPAYVLIRQSGQISVSDEDICSINNTI
ncbi:MAG: hypothetical protein RL150_473 [Candidatus Parcubacteria bacterium]|jgi:prepilin-type N-terminal cleavage/methylation domain-containing protein